VDEELESVYVCSQVCFGDGNCTEPNCEYVMRCVQEEDDGSDGGGGSDGLGGGGDDQIGDDPDGCNYEGGPTDQVCGGGGGQVPSPSPIDSCESANPPDHCDIECKLSASDLEEGYYLYDQASESAKKTFINTLEEQGTSYGLDSQADVRHFIAQTAHESQGAITKVENMNYQDAENLAATFREFTVEGGPETYKASEYTGKPREIAKIVYAGELGNGKEGTGDAYRYRGRGPMQTTGKDNYEAFTDWYQDEGFGSTDFTENPRKLSSDAKIGTLAALQYWDENVLGSDEVDEDNLTVKDVTKAINGGDTGLDTRKEHFERAKDIDCNS
jgi:predicted chitinase